MRNSLRAFLAFTFILAIGCSGTLQVVGLQVAQSIRSNGVIRYLPRVGIHYISRFGTFEESDDILRRDFARFHHDGLSVIVLLVDWYRIENKFERGDYDGNYTEIPRLGGPYGRLVLDGVKRFIGIADEYNLSTVVGVSTLWGKDSTWAIPNYAVDPVTGIVQGLAIVRSSDVRQGFINMFTYFVQQLVATPNILGWHILGEPWYFPRKLPPPYDDIDQKENFITLFEDLTEIVKRLDGRATTVAFVNVHIWKDDTGRLRLFNLFEDDFGWDPRIFNTLDFITFSTTMPYDFPEIIEEWKSITWENIRGCRERDKKIWFMGVGYSGQSSDDDEAQATAMRTIAGFVETLPLELWNVWCWFPDPYYIGRGGNLLKTMEGEPRPAYYELSVF